jgi:hypothetical protein
VNTRASLDKLAHRWATRADYNMRYLISSGEIFSGNKSVIRNLSFLGGEFLRTNSYCMKDLPVCKRRKSPSFL